MCHMTTHDNIEQDILCNNSQFVYVNITNQTGVSEQK